MGLLLLGGVLGAAVLDFLGSITFHSREKLVYINNLGFVGRKIDRDTQKLSQTRKSLGKPRLDKAPLVQDDFWSLIQSLLMVQAL